MPRPKNCASPIPPNKTLFHLEWGFPGSHRVLTCASERSKKSERASCFSIWRSMASRFMCCNFQSCPDRWQDFEAGNVFLISRIQGVKGGYDQVRAATKALGDVVPPALLVV